MAVISIILLLIVVALTYAVVRLSMDNASLRAQLAATPHPLTDSSDAAPLSPQTPQTPKPQTPTAPTPPDDDPVALQQFENLDRQIDADQLFLNPTFGRDDLCRLARLSKDRIGYLIKTYSGATNSQTYIARKRVVYATRLMSEHPNYSMEAIASECGIGNLSTFYRVFKQVYGLSPSEYRQKGQNAEKQTTESAEINTNADKMGIEKRQNGN